MKVNKYHSRGDNLDITTENNKITVKYGILNGPTIELDDDSIILLPDFTVSLDKTYYSARLRQFYLENLTLMKSDTLPEGFVYKDKQYTTVEKYQVGKLWKFVYRLK